MRLILFLDRRQVQRVLWALASEVLGQVTTQRGIQIDHALETSYLCSYKRLTAKGIDVSSICPLTSFLSMRVISLLYRSLMYLISLG